MPFASSGTSQRKAARRKVDRLQRVLSAHIEGVEKDYIYTSTESG